MAPTRVVTLSVTAALGLAGLAEPALAQSANREAIGNLNFLLAYLAIPITAAVELILVYAVIRYHDNESPEPRRENRRLEITWTVATALILLFVGAASLVVLVDPVVSPSAGSSPSATGESGEVAAGAVPPAAGEDAVAVNVTGYQWEWQFTYPESNVTTRDRLVVPANTTVYLYLSSVDVVHSFYSPALDLKQDAFPGQVTTIRTNLTETGTYDVFCTEFCGAGHSRMRAEIEVRSPEAYRQWLASQSGANASAVGDVSAWSTPSGSGGP